mmetsp:Transcript_12071/g.15297  ORF Transcript_12071/g.15297 Transcript_12071/m.15297 type:complete len:93 (+) Transcript_12071:93-371(+)
MLNNALNNKDSSHKIRCVNKCYASKRRALREASFTQEEIKKGEEQTKKNAPLTEKTFFNSFSCVYQFFILPPRSCPSDRRSDDVQFRFRLLN